MGKTQTTTTTETSSQSDAVKVAVMSNEMIHINAALLRLENTLNSAILGFVTHDKLADHEETSRDRHSALVTDVENLAADVLALKNWRDALVSRIAAGAVLLFIAMGLAAYGLNQYL